MSSDTAALSLTDYRRLLNAHLSSDLAALVDFFCNLRRLSLLTRFLQAHCKGAAARVLNVGCGPFAVECFAAPLTDSKFVSFDYTPGFAPLYEAMRVRGKLPQTSFFVGSATDAEFEPASFDLVLMHDLLYEPALDAPNLLRRYHAYLKPGGFLFFDVMDLRIRRLWTFLGKEVGHKRYDLSALRTDLNTHYEIVDCAPYLGVKGPLDALFRRVLWHVFGLANNFAFLIRRR